MRVNAEKDWKLVKEVTLDGKRLDDCVEADTEEGWARCIAHDEAGEIRIENDDYVWETLHGKVEITWHEGAAPNL